MKRREIKKAILKILEETDTELLSEKLSPFKPKDTLNPLFSALCAADERLRWKSVVAFGHVVPRLADDTMEEARVVMRRFLWSLNDESGGIGWGAPEAMASIMVNDDRIRAEYLHMLISYMRGDGPELFEDGNYLELPMLQRGLLWGVAQLCRKKRSVMQEQNVGPDLVTYLDSEDRVVRGMAIHALISLEYTGAEERVAKIADDESEVTIFENGDYIHTSVADLAAAYLNSNRINDNQ